MKQAFVEINAHKVFCVQIIESPVFQCIFAQNFVENMDEFKKHIPNKDTSMVMMSLNAEEFSVLADVIISYRNELEQVSKSTKEFVKAEK
jgi:hypothetical protein